MNINLISEKSASINRYVSLWRNSKILKGLDDNILIRTILKDLQKAFNTINHGILLRKLGIIGFSNHTLKWHQYYPSNCKFMVNLKNPLSKISNISCGVPQVSILGP